MTKYVAYIDMYKEYANTPYAAVFKELKNVKLNHIPSEWIEKNFLSTGKNNAAEVEDYWFVTEETEYSKEFYLVVKFRVGKRSRFNYASSDIDEPLIYIEQSYFLDGLGDKSNYEIITLLVEMTALHEETLEIDWSRLRDFVFGVDITLSNDGRHYTIKSIYTNEDNYFVQMPNYNTELWSNSVYDLFGDIENIALEQNQLRELRLSKNQQVLNNISEGDEREDEVTL